VKNLLTALIMLFCNCCFGQSAAIQSSIINFGSNNCGNTSAVTFSAIGNPLTSPYQITSCSLNPPLSDVFSKFIAYNPKDNNIYIDDISHGDSRIYIYNMGLPNSYTCPAVMPQTPTYEYSYIPNNFEFDINGDNWSIRSLSGNTAILERIDETTGTVIFSKTLTFPASNVPNTLGSGDIVIAPNGRMFITMGDGPSKFYEITNYGVTTSGNAVANFIQNMPSPCYGIAYIDGKIELTGTDFGSNCYKYIYDIPSMVMSGQQTFQLNLTPVDNTSISPATGISKQIVATTIIDSTTADITYEIFAKNMGNVVLKNYNIYENLARVYGTGNVSNVVTSFVTNSNPANLVLNPSFNGVSDTSIFAANQTFTNLANGIVGVYVSLKASHLSAATVYYNTAKSYGEIGAGATLISVIDSSNNGDVTLIDPNGDGDAGDYNENVPTPFYFGSVLPIRFISVQAKRINSNLNTVNWVVAANQTTLSKFDVEYSIDNFNWELAGTVSAENNKTSYSFNHPASDENNSYYRITAYDSNGKNYISNEAFIAEEDAKRNAPVIMPNPANSQVKVYAPQDIYTSNRMVYILDASGKKLFAQPFTSKYATINCSGFADGYYIVNIIDKGINTNSPLIIKH
jgi:hypothetical protein